MDQNKIIILAIDDIEDNLISLKAVIKDALPQAIVFTANNGLAGIEIAQKTNPDVILLDIVMPEMDGYSICRMIKSDPELQITPVVFLTAQKSDRESRIQALETGADGFLSKPIEEQELIAQIRAMVKLKAAEVNKRTENSRLTELVEIRTRELEKSNQVLLRNQEVMTKTLDDLKNEMLLRKQSDTALIENELRLRTLINAMPDVVCFKDGEGRWLEANEYELKLFQLEGVDYHGKKDSELAQINPFYTEAFKACEATDEIAWKNASVSRSDEKIPQPDGSEKTFDIIKVPTFNEDGSRRGLIIVGRDITDRVKIENDLHRAYQVSELLVEDLRKGENLLQKVFDILPIGLWIADKTGKLISSNEAGRKIWGGEPYVSQEEYSIFKAYRLPSREEIAPEDWALAHTVNEGVTVKDELLEIAALDGEKRIILNYTAPVLDEQNQVEAAIVVNQDITEDFRNDMILRLQSNIAKAVVSIDKLSELFAFIRQELAVLFDTTNFIYAIYDESTDMLYAPFNADETDENINSWKAEKSLTGYLLKHGKPLLLTKAEMLALPANLDVEIVGAPAQCWMGVPLFKLEKPSGAVIVQSYDNPGAYNQKSLEVLEIIAHEMSIYIEKKESEEELVKAKDKAEESDRLKTGFLQNMSHEIRTPMHGILGFTSLLEQDNISPLEVKEFAGYIRTSGNRMIELINNILDISKIESGEIEVVSNRASLLKLMKDLYMLFSPLCQAKRIEFVYFIPPELMEITLLTDDLKVMQIMSNLISNAVKFTSQGRVEFSCSLQNSNLEFQVRDTGCGIKEEHRLHIFDRFYQADMSMARGYEGAGLGLSICQGLAKCINGAISFETEVDKGSVFTFSLPAVLENIVAEKVKNATVAPTPQKRVVLVAEDDDVNFYYLQKVLKMHQMQVLRAVNGLEAIEIADNRPDLNLILMDIKMPVMNGLEATKHIRQLRPELPIIAQTAYAYENEKSIALESGCNDYLVKPISSVDLIHCITVNIE